jgi:hypothetical protein
MQPKTVLITGHNHTHNSGMTLAGPHGRCPGQLAAKSARLVRVAPLGGWTYVNCANQHKPLGKNMAYLHLL